MVEPNFNMFLWFLLVLMGLNALCSIVLGIVKNGETKEWDYADSVMGLIILVVILLVVLS